MGIEADEWLTKWDHLPFHLSVADYHLLEGYTAGTPRR
jgi:hypothetical protein